MPAALEPAADVAAHPVVAAVRGLAADLLAPAAERVDAEGVPASHLAALAVAGVFGLGGPPEHGGRAVPAAVAREVTETLAGACGSTWFVAAQHATPVRVLAETDNTGLRDRWLGRLCRGDAVGGIALAHVRRPDAPVRVARSGAGWRFDGTATWYTGWGLNHVMLLAGVTDGGDVVFAVRPARPQPGLAAGADLPLAAMQATHTVELTLDGLAVPDEDVALVVPRARWLADDRARTANASPAVFGLLRALLDALARQAGERDLPEAAAFADRAGERAAALREAAYRLVDDVDPAERTAERLDLRVAALGLLGRVAHAYVAACGGAAMSRRHRAQRWAREAMFHLVQAQTAAVRAATLAAFDRNL
jgi:alkylation response protein AidB-like acyl-CoA dehydrogenase